jgi:hypothetical protein
MDGKTFDDLIRRFCTIRLTRVSALRGLVTGAATALTGAALASDETDAKKKGGKGRQKSSKGKSGRKKKGGKKGKKRQPQTKQRPQIRQEPLCAEGHVALCHNSTNENGGVIQCPNGSSTNLAGHCGHNDEDANPFDCFCKDGGFDPNFHCLGFTPQLQECFDCSGDGSCFFVCQPDLCPQPDPDDPCKEAVCINNACAIQNKADGTTCDDGLFCTVDDVCTDGVCGGRPRDCSGETDQCNLGVCDEAADACVKQPTPGVTCDDGLFCTVDDVCDADGVCGGSPRDCSAESDQCNDGVCDEDADACVAQPKPDGTACDDGLFCTVDDVCTGGVCGGSPRVCPSDECNDGVCDEANDACVLDPKDDNTVCGPNGEDICCAGVCTDNDTNENCGACGNVCPPGHTCTGGICVPPEICPDEFSPKPCGGIQVTCKAEASGEGCGVNSDNPPQGSVQVVCTDGVATCVCNSRTCTVDGTIFARGEVTTCTAVPCA